MYLFFRMILIKKIVIHKKEIIDGKKTQRVDVYFNGLGETKF